MLALSQLIQMATYLVLIELVKSLGFDFLNGVVLAGWNMLSFVDLGILFARAEQVNLFKVLLPKHAREMF